MELEKIATLVVTLLPPVTAAGTAIVTTATGRDRQRRQMHSDAELVERLPSDSAARESVLELIEASAKELLQRRSYTVDKSALGLAVVGTVGLGLFGVWLANRDAVWAWIALAPVAFLWLVFFVGIFESAQRKDRVAEKQKREEKKAAKKAERKARQAIKQ